MKHLYLFAAACIMASTATAATPTLTKVDNLTPVTRAEIKTDRIHGTAPSKAVNTMKVASRADEELTWTAIGDAEFSEDAIAILFSGSYITYNVPIEECNETPGLYRLVDPYINYPYNQAIGTYSYDDTTPHYMIIHAERADAVWIEDFATGLKWWDYDEFSIESDVQNFLEQGYSLDVIAASGFCGTLKGGVISFPVNYLYVRLGGKLYYANQNGEFKIKLPGAKDYSVNISAPSCADDNTIPITVSFGSDVTNAYYAIAPGEYHVNDEILAIVPHMERDFPAESGTYRFSLEGFEKGRYTFFIVSTDDEGKVLGGNATFFYCMPDEDEYWTSIGTGTYGEEFVGSQYKIGATEYAVEIEEHKDIPGYYRLVDPYGANSAWPGASTNYHEADGHRHFVYINAEDPTRVYIEESPIGVDWGYGDMIITSYAKYFLDADYSADEVAEAGLFGSMDESGTITFPIKALAFAETQYQRGEWFDANTEGKFMVKLPSEYVSGIKSVINNENGEAVYYNLQGVRVANPTNGIFIMKSGNTVTKVIR